MLDPDVPCNLQALLTLRRSIAGLWLCHASLNQTWQFSHSGEFTEEGLCVLFNAIVHQRAESFSSLFCDNEPSEMFYYLNCRLLSF